MEDLVSRLVERVGLSEEQAWRTVEIVVGFVRDAGPPDKVPLLMASLPGSEQVAGSGAGVFGGMMGAMAALNSLTALGLDMGQIQRATKEIIGYARERAGQPLVDDVVRSIPGLSQFV